MQIPRMIATLLNTARGSYFLYDKGINIVIIDEGPSSGDDTSLPRIASICEIQGRLLLETMILRRIPGHVGEYDMANGPCTTLKVSQWHKRYVLRKRRRYARISGT